MKSITLPLCALLVLPGLATADEKPKIYRWTEPDGTVTYSNEPQRVPQDGKAEPTEGEEIGVLPAEKRQVAPPPTREQLEEAKLHAELRRAEAEARRAEADTEAARQRREDEWRFAFRSAHAKIEQLEAELEEERALLELNGLPVIGRQVIRVRPVTPAGTVIDDRYERARVRVPQLEKALNAAKNELEELERRASFASVPRHLRRR